MEIDNQSRPAKPLTTNSTPVSKSVAPDGLLLYVAEASYEAGSSPLSSWIPIATSHDTVEAPLSAASDNPLELFQR
jgi:snurportin-1